MTRLTKMCSIFGVFAIGGRLPCGVLVVNLCMFMCFQFDGASFNILKFSFKNVQTFRHSAVFT